MTDRARRRAEERARLQARRVARRRRAVASLCLAALVLVGVGISVWSSRPDASADEGAVTIAWVGDITPGSKYGLPPEDGRYQFQSVARELRSADLTIGNLEGTLGSGGWDKCAGSTSSNCFAFQAPVSMTSSLKGAGFDVFNLANNHALDYGQEGQAQTVAALKAAGIRHTGRPGEVTYVERNGIRIAILGFAPYAWASPLLNLEEAAAQISAAREKADLVVVAIHAGAEGEDKVHVPAGNELAMGEDRGNSRAFAEMAVRSGADLVVGSGPHVPRGLEVIDSRIVAYSTGNFSGWKNFSTRGNMGLSVILKVTLSRSGKFLKGRLVPVRLSADGVPTLDPSGESLSLMRNVSKEDFGQRAAGITGNGSVKLNGV